MTEQMAGDTADPFAELRAEVARRAALRDEARDAFAVARRAFGDTERSYMQASLRLTHAETEAELAARAAWVPPRTPTRVPATHYVGGILVVGSQP